jgi:ubiquinone/menaquinone biosynthesis C-methylase UbiE
MSVDKEIDIQRRFFADIAEKYQEEYVPQDQEHFLALSFLVAAIDYLKFESVLDIGSGTGRAISYIKQRRPDLRIVGIEPVSEMREVGYAQGISREELIDGDATRIGFANEEFDVVCEFGALHHIKQPRLAVTEMLRVARKAIFISDANNFGEGAPLSRTIKQVLNALGLWKLADYLNTRGKGYRISDDGLSYSYSVFNDYELIRRHCKSIHILNTKDAGKNIYRSASHIALLGIKR